MTSQETRRPLDRSGFTLAVICALPLERNAVEAVMARDYRDDGHKYGKHHTDTNTYALGELGGQPIVLLCLEDAGTRYATQAARNMSVSFENIRLCFLVGITGGTPFKKDGSQSGIRLGDVIISETVIEYDFGKQLENKFETITALARQLPRTAEIVNSFLRSIDGSRSFRRLERNTNASFDDFPDLKAAEFKYPGRKSDRIYSPATRHKHLNNSCEVCMLANDTAGDVCDAALNSSCQELGCEALPQTGGSDREQTRVFLGPYASGSGVIKSSQKRDQLVRDFGVLAIEMEGAGVWGTFPTMVIKGVVDYADSHKSKLWRHYPAARAALCLRAVIDEMDFSATSPEPLPRTCQSQFRPACKMVE